MGKKDFFKSHLMFFIFGMFVLLLISGCYKTPPELAEAQKAVQAAREAEAPKYAAQEFKSAEDLLGQAEGMDKKKKEKETRDYSIQARDKANEALQKALAEAERQRQLAAQKEKAPKETSKPSLPSNLEAEKARLKLKELQDNKVYFDFDRYNIREDMRPIIAENAQILREFPNKPVTIEGHCDERGSDEYNLALGERRADATKRYLTSLGINESRVDTVSYGESRPADPGHGESAWAKNRRAEFVVSGE